MDIRGRVIRGGAVKLISQLAVTVLRIGYVAVMARLLSPADFGLLAMVTVVTGFLDVFATGGLSSATIQRTDISDEQVSGLFWINVAIGCALSVICLLSGPLIVHLYGEPQVAWIAAALAPIFLINALGVQHGAILMRHLRYEMQSAIDLASQLVSIVVGVAMAWAGFSYWSLIAAALVVPATSAALVWRAVDWRPQRPGVPAGLGSLLQFGGTVTLNGVVVYLSYNLERALLGRYWGIDALGYYTRGQAVVGMATNSVSSAIGSVAFTALSRLQREPERLKGYFIRAFSLLMGAVVPPTLLCALCATEVVHLLLGPKWSAAIPVVQLLAPSMLVFAVLNSLGPFIVAIGMQNRSLYLGFALAVVMITAYVIGLPYGITGVALSFSVAMCLWMVPHVAWCLHGTNLTVREFFMAAARPMLAGGAGAAATMGVQLATEGFTPLLRLVAASVVFLSVYGFVLLIALGQLAVYRSLVTAIKDAN